MRAPWIVAIVLAVGCTKPHPDDRKTAELLVKKLAFEAYPQWSVANPAKSCPDKVDDLWKLGETDGKDPWGKPVKLLCGPDVPKDVVGVGIASAGPDGQFGTADDVNSWTR